MLANAGVLRIDIRGSGSDPGLSGPSHASCHADRSCRLGLPVRAFDLIVSREPATTIFCRKLSDTSESVVASQTDPVHAPAAPIAMQPAICSPVMMPPA